MSLFNTEHKRKSATITTIVMVALLIIMFLFGMQYLDPPEESGIAVNFGTTNVGSGNEQPKDALKPKTAPESQEKEVEEQTESQPEEQTETVTEEVSSEEVVTQDSEESIAIKKAEEAKRKAAEEAKKAKAEADRIAKEKREAEEKKRQEEAAKKAKLDAMMNGVNNSNGNEEGGEGPGDGEGDKGNPNGDPYAASYYGDPGTGNGGAGGYGLNGRSKIGGGNVDKQDCNESGRVVVKITVNREGKVIDAVAGVRGTTNKAACLLKPAEKAAYEYRWNKDSKAPATQTGFIVVNFKIGQ
ncbi:energy transducer TonB family protein [Kordia zhangzhouensis]|uniref:energy transducer TonB family protein n=1 Tax=Kordia zhangzhouensis TaxID=1620405 RepID=UPI000629C9AF|nr:energy transducer TonB [Kordia zhangzhouensis]